MIMRGKVMAENWACNEKNVFGFVLCPIAKNQASRG